MRLVSLIFLVTLSQRGLAHGIMRHLKQDKTPWPTPAPSSEPTLAPTPYPTLIQTYEPSAEAVKVNAPSIHLFSDSNDVSPTTAPATNAPSIEAQTNETTDDYIFVDLPEMTLSLTMPGNAGQSLITTTVSTHVTNFINGAFRAEFDTTSFRYSHVELLVLPITTNNTRGDRRLQSVGVTTTTTNFLLTDGRAAFIGFPMPSGDLLTYFLGKLFAQGGAAVNQYWNFGDSLKESNDDALSQVLTFDVLIHVEPTLLVVVSESEEDRISNQEDEVEEDDNTEADVAGMDPAIDEQNVQQDESTSSRRRDVILGVLIGVFAAAFVIGGAFIGKKRRRNKSGPRRRRVYSDEMEGDIYSTNSSSEVPVGDEQSWAGLTVEDSMRMSPGSGVAERWASIHDGSEKMPTWDATRLEKIISMSNAVVSNSTCTEHAKVET